METITIHPDKNKYIIAFCNVLNCTENDFEIQVKETYCIIKLNSNNQCYKIITVDNLFLELEQACEHPETVAFQIPYNFIAEADDGDMFCDAEFYPAFLKIKPKPLPEEILHFKYALQYASLTLNDENDEEGMRNRFWRKVSDCNDTYGKCILALLNLYNKEIFLKEVFDSLTESGEDIYCEMKNGIFELIALSSTTLKVHNILEDDDDDKIFFYIYSVDEYYFNDKILNRKMLIEK